MPLLCLHGTYRLYTATVVTAGDARCPVTRSRQVASVLSMLRAGVIGGARLLPIIRSYDVV
jgi:hypothetical protein